MKKHVIKMMLATVAVLGCVLLHHPIEVKAAMSYVSYGEKPPEGCNWTCPVGSDKFTWWIGDPLLAMSREEAAEKIRSQGYSEEYVQDFLVKWQESREYRGSEQEVEDAIQYLIDFGFELTDEEIDDYAYGWIEEYKEHFAGSDGYKETNYVPRSSGKKKSSNTSSAVEGSSSSSGAKSETEAEPEVTYTQDEIDAAWTEVNRVEATCTETGYVDYENSLTGETKTEELPLANHSYAVIETVDATCTEAGTKTYTCSVCGDSYSEEVLAKSHTAGTAEVSKEPKLFAEGESTVKCEECGEVLSTEVLPQTCPLPLAAVLGIVGVTMVGIITTVVVIVNRKREE